MIRPSSLAALAIALILHAVLIALAITGLPVQKDDPARPATMTVQILPPQEKEAAAKEAPAALPPPAPSPPEQKLPDSKPVSRPKPVPKPKPKPALTPRVPRERPTPEARPPAAASVPAPGAEPAEPAPAAPSPPVATAAPQAPAAPVPPARTGVYISAEHAATNVKPAYPAMAKRYGEQGTVVLRVLVNADGTAGQVEVRTSSGYPLLDESARTAVQRWRFRPATVDGKPVADWYLQSIPFKLQN